MKMAGKSHLMILGGVEASLNLAISWLDSKEINKKEVRQLLESLRPDIKAVRQELQLNYTTTKNQAD